MRPIKLTMTAFGPYGGTEIVDFRDATDAGLFGIYGPTGSGKSSIFSAIAFALFGVGAKEEQGMNSMRSHFASADTLTEVSLLFELGEKRYFVRRIPDQTKPKARGEGETNQSHAAWLFDATALEIGDIEADNPGTPIAERKVSDVLREIEHLLGYGAQQFRQIVLLPQGRFERFLVANSSDRLEILRDLFDVSLYRRLTEQLKSDAITAKREIQDGYRLNAQQLSAQGFASTDELVSGISLASDQHQLLQLVSSEKTEVLKNAASSLAIADSQERLFIEGELSAAALADQERKIPEFNTVRSRRSNAELARRLSDLDEAASAARERLRQAEIAVSQTNETASHWRNALSKAELTLSGLKASEGEIDALSRKLEEMGRFRQTLQDASERLAALRGTQNQLLNAEQSYAATRGSLANAVADEGIKSKALAHAQESISILLVLQAKHNKLSTERAAALQYNEVTAIISQTEAKLTQAGIQREEAQKAHFNAVEHEDNCENQFISAQAGFLAQHLKHDEGCPVCGSTDHPNPAHGDGNAISLEKAWRNAQLLRTTAAKAASDAQALHSSITGNLDTQKLAFRKLAIPDRVLATIEDELLSCSESIQRLGTQADIPQLQAELAELSATRQAMEEKLEQANLLLVEANMQVALNKQAYDDRIASVPPEWHIVSDLQSAIEDTTLAIDARKKAITDAVQKQQEANSTSVRAISEYQSALLRLADSKLAAGSRESAFSLRLSELGLSEPKYRASIHDIDSIDEFQRTLAEFDQALISARARNEAAVKLIAGAHRPELGPLKLAYETAQREIEEASHNSAKAAQHHASLLHLQSSLAQQLKSLQEQEELSGPLLGLADAFSGENLCKTSLETYAIGAMFDEVLEAANLRLDPMTAGRYRFERDAVSSGGKSKRGLDVLVNDIETGRTREIITLSGGETFIAALSLALGLSDVVERTHGAIRLDTIFIDEGFGSLDTESDAGTLDQVLQVLQNIVGNRRAVGLISHVPMVQQAVPNGFTVIKSSCGSSIEPRVL
jgi:DNA repair protein SbcC/Rad50